MTTDKHALRARLKAARNRAPRATLPVPDVFLTRLRAEIIVAAYLPVGSEADPSPLARAAVTAGCRLALPYVVDRPTPLRFLAWADGIALADGPFGLRQPRADADELAPDIILTPLVGFDRSGNRVGQGAGHYDRAFAAYPRAWRVGIGYAVQEVPALLPDAWDVPLHAILTEKEWIVP